MMGLRGRLLAVVSLVLLAAIVRVYGLDAVPLRGDEAFSVRFWADDPRQTWADLAGYEPHPIGTFVAFWAWRNLASEGEFTMRALPMLANLLGVAVMLALGRHFRLKAPDTLAVGLLWALNPFQVWHAQDLRNYAIWAALSPLALLLFLRAIKANRQRDWLIYGIAQSAALHSFLLEPFFLLVQLGALILCASPRKPESKKIWRSAFITWGLIGLFMLPLGWQMARLATSGYGGTAEGVSLRLLLGQFMPSLLFGERELSLGMGGLLLILPALGLILARRGKWQDRALLLMWVYLPLLLLIVLGTQMDIFRPRYVIAITAPLLLAWVWSALGGGAKVARLVSLVLIGFGLLGIYDYFRVAPPKAPDWRSMAAYLESRADENDLIILANVDPAFRYYYRGAAADMPWSDVADFAEILGAYRGLYVQNADSTFEIGQFLQREAQEIYPSTALLKQYRAYGVDVDEIAQPLDLYFGDVARLRGYSLLGGDQFGLTVLLYWQPLRQTKGEYVGFVHALYDDGRLADQDDHAPLHGNAPTTIWLSGSLLRDPFLLRLPNGTYALEVGMYPAEDSANPLLIYDAAGVELGRRYRLDDFDLIDAE